MFRCLRGCARPCSAGHVGVEGEGEGSHLGQLHARHACPCKVGWFGFEGKGSLLAVCSGILPGRAQGTIRGAAVEPRLAVCKAGVSPTLLSLALL